MLHGIYPEIIIKDRDTYELSKELCSLFHDNSGSNSNVLHTSVTLQQEPMHHGLQFNKLTFLSK